MKLYVWTDFSPDYTSGLAFAIAESLEEAQKMIVDERGFEVFEWGVLSIHELDTKIAASVSGGS